MLTKTINLIGQDVVTTYALFGIRFYRLTVGLEIVGIGYAYK